jgi:hypothetical protein
LAFLCEIRIRNGSRKSQCNAQYENKSPDNHKGRSRPPPRCGRLCVFLQQIGRFQGGCVKASTFFRKRPTYFLNIYPGLLIPILTRAWVIRPPQGIVNRGENFFLRIICFFLCIFVTFLLLFLLLCCCCCYSFLWVCRRYS